MRRKADERRSVPSVGHLQRVVPVFLRDSNGLESVDHFWVIKAFEIEHLRELQF